MIVAAGDLGAAASPTASSHHEPENAVADVEALTTASRPAAADGQVTAAGFVCHGCETHIADPHLLRAVEK